MSSPDGNAPAWLFSFVDLAFLLLIAMTQLSTFDEERRNFAELIVPQLNGGATDAIGADASPTWQLRVLPPAEPPCYELVHPPAEGLRFDEAALRVALQKLQSGGGPRPLIAPHPDSRAQDLLAAVDLIEELWPSNRHALVQRVGTPP